MTTSPFTFADLSTPEGRDVIRARLIANLTADGQPTGSWAPSAVGGVENLRADMLAGGLADLIATRIGRLVAGHVLPLATDDPALGYFLSYYGLRYYGLEKRLASKTIQNIRLTAASSAGANTFSDGDVVVKSPSTGNVYRLTLDPGISVELRPGDSVDVPCYAENAGSRYLDPAGTVTQMVTAKAGVTCSNLPPSQFTPTRSTGGSSGTITGGYSAVPTTPSVRIRIDISGDVGSGMFSWSTNGGLTWTPGGPIPNSYSIGGGGDLTFTNGGTSPSFVQGSIFTLRVADAILRRGTDDDTDDLFRRMCSNRHPAISLVPTRAHVELWAWRASSEVVRIMSRGDPNRSGGILVTIASQTGPASPAAQEAVEDYILLRLAGFKGVPAPASPAVPKSGSPEESVMVSSATRYQVKATGVVYVPVDQLDAARAGADQKWDEYLATVPLGGQPDATVQREDLFTLLGLLGAQDVQGLQLNATSADLVVPPYQVAVPADNWTLRDGLSWVATT